MINNDWERFGEDIRRTIQDAVDSRDFSRLNQTVSDTIGQAMDNVSRGLKNGGWYRERPMGGNWGNPRAYAPHYEQQGVRTENLQEKKKILPKKWGVKTPPKCPKARRITEKLKAKGTLAIRRNHKYPAPSKEKKREVSKNRP